MFVEIFTYELGANFFNHLVFHFAIVFYLVLIPPVLSLIDLSFAIGTARKLGESVRSHKLRKTLEKISRYWLFQFGAATVGTMGLLFPWYNLPYVAILATLAITVIEFRSYIEHWRRRRDHMSKLPEALGDILEFARSDRKSLDNIIRTIGQLRDSAAATTPSEQ